MNKGILSIVVFFMVSGCSFAPKYSISPSIEKTDLAKVHIYRTSVAYHSLNPERPFFYIDGEYVGMLSTGSSRSIEVIPGNHTITVKESMLFMAAYENGSVQFVAEPNKEYYVRYSKNFSGISMAGTTATATGTETLQMANKEYFVEKK